MALFLKQQLVETRILLMDRAQIPPPSLFLIFVYFLFYAFLGWVRLGLPRRVGKEV